MNIQYIIVVFLVIIIVPLTGAYFESKNQNTTFSFELLGKWFIFSAVGLRLFIAGIKQILTPEFTAVQIFHIQCLDVFPIVRELGFANLCFGLIGIISLAKPQWRIVSAFGSGIYYGLAAFMHLTKGTVGINEKFALITDVLIFIFLLVYVIRNYKK